MENDTLLHKWYNKTISKEELEEFKKRPEYDSLVLLEKETADLTGPELDTEQMLKEILGTNKVTDGESIRVEPKQDTKVRSLSIWTKLAAAASLIFIAGYFLMPDRNNLVTYELAEAQQIEGTLPDQSTYVLEENSKLQYDRTDWLNNRSLSLEGEAYFSVNKGSTFTVNTSAGKVVVLGTQFTVVSDDQVFNVSCKEGKVLVKSTTDVKYEETLTAGESVRQNLGGYMITKKKGLTKMKNATLEDVTNELSNQFGISITSEGLDMSEILSCNFQHTDLSSALKTALAPMGIKYNIASNDTVKLYK